MGRFWAAWAVTGAVAETYALRHPGNTLSENVRKVTRRPGARGITLVGWLAFSSWFAFHIWR